MTYIQDNKNLITSSKLKCFKYCPQQYELNFVHEIERDDTVPMKIGTAIHLLMEGGYSKFNEVYHAMETWERRNSKDKKEETRIILTAWEYETIHWIYQEVLRQDIFDLKNPKYEKEKEVIHWNLKCKIDRICVEDWVIRDWKFIKDCSKFERDYFSPLWYDYKWQWLFYAYVCELVYWKPFTIFFDVCDKNWKACCFEHKPKKEDFPEIPFLINNLLEMSKGEFKWKEFRDLCIKCPYYKHCDLSALQKETVKI